MAPQCHPGQRPAHIMPVLSWGHPVPMEVASPLWHFAWSLKQDTYSRCLVAGRIFLLGFYVAALAPRQPAENMNAWRLRVLSQLQETLPAILDGLPSPKPLLSRKVPHLT